VFCTKCGVETPDDSQFCRKCGKPLAVAATTDGAAVAVAPARVAKSTNETPKAETRRWRGGIIAFLVLAVLVWIFILQNVGTKNATQMVATAVHAPIELKNEVQNLQASSWKGISINVPYSGTVNVELEVVHGNPIDVLLTTADNWKR